MVGVMIEVASVIEVTVIEIAIMIEPRSYSNYDRRRPISGNKNAVRRIVAIHPGITRAGAHRTNHRYRRRSAKPNSKRHSGSGE